MSGWNPLFFLSVETGSILDQDSLDTCFLSLVHVTLGSIRTLPFQSPRRDGYNLALSVLVLFLLWSRLLWDSSKRDLRGETFLGSGSGP